MPTLTIVTQPELAVFTDGQPLALPASKRTRALLAFLALTARPQRRDRLCEVFWSMPDDPRGALRWALSKLRPLVNSDPDERLVADRERVLLETEDVAIDVRQVAAELRINDLDSDRLTEIATRLQEPFLEGLELPNQPLFAEWLAAERADLERLTIKALSHLARHKELTPDKAVRWSQAWLDRDPFNVSAATLFLTHLDQLGQEAILASQSARLERQFRQAGIRWSPDDRVRHDPEPIVDASSELDTRRLKARQKIQFCTAADGTRLAYAMLGEGTPIVKAANWLSHLELDWDAPIWSPLFRHLAREHQFVRYDERGNGLSDWDVGDISFDAFVADLETVTDATGLERFALLGISQGAAVSIEYAVRYPERVSHLILFGGYPSGWRIAASPETIKEREAVMTLTASGWGQDNPAYRQIFSSTFMPSANSDVLAWFNEFQRRTTSPENAVRFLSAFGDIDVRHRLTEVSVPTLVIHSLGDRRISVETGRDIAARIPGAEFLGLESDGHLLVGHEPASRAFVDAVSRFISGA